MINQDIKKGDTVMVEYKNNSKLLEKTVGVVYAITDNYILIVHNFSGFLPVDQTEITRESIISLEIILPTEINKIEELE